MESLFLFPHLFESSCSLSGLMSLLGHLPATPLLGVSHRPQDQASPAGSHCLLVRLRAPSTFWQTLHALLECSEALVTPPSGLPVNPSSQGNSLLWPSLLLAQVVARLLSFQVTYAAIQ